MDEKWVALRVDNVSQLKAIILHHIVGQMVPDEGCNKSGKIDQINVVFDTCLRGDCPPLVELSFRAGVCSLCSDLSVDRMHPGRDDRNEGFPFKVNFVHI